MKIIEINNCPTLIEVEFEHPEYGVEYHTLVWDEPFDDSETYDDLSKAIWEKYNRHNIFFEMKITFFYKVENKIHKNEIHKDLSNL